MRLRHLSVCFAASALLSCSDSTGLRLPTAVFTLQAVDGTPPPVRPNPLSSVTIHSEALLFEANGIGRRRVVHRLDGDPYLQGDVVGDLWMIDSSHLYRVPTVFRSIN